ncbi:MAG TPA: DUF5657 family protein [Patescibacteria group bacterium]|nr:DUF5657 family protein [Patescibacteria group bacterium]
MEAVPAASTNPFFLNIISGAFEIGFLAFGVVYFIFTLIVLRQVNLMTSTIKTEGAGVLKALAILYCGLSLGVIVLIIGLF